MDLCLHIAIILHPDHFSHFSDDASLVTDPGEDYT